MRILKRSLTVALLLFVGATVGMLIAQEVLHPDVEPAADARSLGSDEVTDAEVAAATSQQSVPYAVEPTSAADEAAEASGSKESVPETAPAVETAASATASCVVDAIYFHNTARCYTCRNIEATARAVLEAEFPVELAEGRLRWSTINMEKQRHYVDQYSLAMPTLILVRSVDDEAQDWVSLGETWALIRDESRFSMYIENSTSEFLGGCP